MAERVIEAEARITAVDRTGRVFESIAKRFRILDQTTDRSGIGLSKWGTQFQKELEKLKLTPRIFGDVGRAWDNLIAKQRSDRLSLAPRIHEQERWKEATLAQLRQVDQAYQRTARLQAKLGHFARNVGGVAAGYVGYEAGHYAAEQVGEQDRERARQWLGGMSPAESAAAATKARELSTKYPSVGPLSVVEHIRQLRARFGNFKEALANVEDLVKAQVVLQTLTGGENSSADLERLVLGLEGIGAGADPRKFHTYLSAFVKAKSLFPDIKGEDFRVYLQRAKAGKYGLSDEYLTQVVPTMIQHEGATQFGTEQASAFSALVGHRQTKAARRTMDRYGLVDHDTGNIVDEAGFTRDPRKWAQQHLRSQLAKQHLDLTPENRAALIAVIQRMFSNRNVGEFFTSLLVNDSLIAKDAKMLAAAKGLDSASELRTRDPFVALKGVTEQLSGLVQTIGGPFGLKAAGVLNSIADALARMAKVTGNDPKKAEIWGETAAAGGTGLGLLLGRKALRWLLDVPKGEALLGDATKLWFGRMGLLGSLLTLRGDTMPITSPWINKWRVPEGWDYTRDAKGGFAVSPGSTSQGFTRRSSTWLPGWFPGASEPPLHFTPLHMQPTAEVKGSADLNVHVEVEPSADFLSRIVSAVRNEINVFGGPGAGVGTAGSTGLSMPEAAPSP